MKQSYQTKSGKKRDSRHHERVKLEMSKSAISITHKK